MTAHLLDSNVLIALTAAEHVHHEAAVAWLGTAGRFATCPTVQGALLRALLRQGSAVVDALRVLASVTTDPRHDQWLDDLVYTHVEMAGVLGHRQVTDAYLAQLARTRGGRLATLDRGLAAMAPDVVDLVPVS